jgi:peptide/nickel transport system substrate-binding protein
MLLSGLCLTLCIVGLAYGQASAGGTLVFGRVADSSFLDPAKFLDNESAVVIENVFDGLVRYKDDSTMIEPALATSWDTSGDGLTWTFHLRRGVHFHDGSPGDAQAAAFSLLRKIDPTHPYHRDTFGKMDSTLKSVRSIEAKDAHTLVITLSEPYAPLLNVLATHSSYIISPAAVRKWGDDFETHPVGTGPFVFQQWQPQDRIVLAANKDYWGGKPALDQVVFRVIPDNRARLIELKTEAIHLMDGINPDDREEILKTPDLRLDSKPGLNVGYLAMNTDRPPFNRAEVRRAVNHAINKQGLVKLLFRNMATPAKNPIPPTMWGHADQISDYGYDPDKARQLLKEAGYPNGFETTLWAMPVPRPYMPQPDKIAQAIQANLAAVGIRARIVTHYWKTYLSKVYAGEHDMCLLGWIGTGDPNDFFYHLFDSDNTIKPHASNVAFFRDPAAHDLILKAQRTIADPERVELYARLQQLVHDQAPWTPLAHAHQVLARDRRVHGVVLHQTGVIRFQHAWLEQDPS